MKKEKWIEKWKEKLADCSEPLPDSGWERLEKALAPPAIEKKIYPFRRWTIGAAAVLLLLIGSSLSIYFLQTPIAEEIRQAQIQTQTHGAAVSTDEQLAEKQPEGTSSFTPPSPHDMVKRKERLAKAEIPVKVAITPVVDRTEDETASSEINAVEEDTPSHKEEVKSKKETVSVRRPSGKDKLHIPIENSPSRKGKWSVGLSVGNTGVTSSVNAMPSMQYDMYRVNTLSFSDNLVDIPEDKSLVFSEGVPYLQDRRFVDAKHHQPISFGISFRRNLRKGFSIESGVTYTLLSSDITLSDSNQPLEQKLHYLGIPIRGGWNFLDKKLFTLYVSAGGMVEKCVYGKVGTEQETVKPLQFSLSGGVGVQLNATKHIGIYVEPGIVYYFDDGSHLQTIRKETPFNFHMQGGLRLTY